jgi:hypothetical protein
VLKNLIAVIVVCGAILGGAYYWFKAIPKPDLSNRGEPVICKSEPQFSEYPISPVSTEKIKWVIWDSNKLAREMQAEIEAATASAANFAGQYLIVDAKCGDNCQKHAMIDIPSGHIRSYGLTSATGLEYRPDSNLLVVNPTPVPQKATIYYEFTGALNYICEQTL